jgi:flagellar basal-body rod modification protein FlgD
VLLTTQLKNQSPLDPLDTNQFTQQLVQFAGVEQQLKSNDTLSSILTAMRSSSTSNAASYIGMKVTADGSAAPWQAGPRPGPSAPRRTRSVRP